MPLFDYTCSHCEAVDTDVLVKSHRDPHYCVCGAEMHKLPAAPNAHFKGGTDTPLRPMRKPPVPGGTPVSLRRA